MLTKYSFKELARMDLALVKLQFSSVSSGIFGRQLLHLQRTEKSERQTRFSSGDTVAVFAGGREYS